MLSVIKKPILSSQSICYNELNFNVVNFLLINIFKLTVNIWNYINEHFSS